MARKPYAELSAAYRARLDRAAAEQGISGSELHNRPDLLRAARGHATTPEHGEAISHVEPKRYVREQWEIGKPGPRGGGRPRPRDVRKVLDANISSPDVIVTLTFVAPSTIAEEEDKKKYKREDEEEEEEELEEDEEEEERPAKKPRSNKYELPPGQERYVYSSTINRSQLRLTMDTIAGLPRADQKAGMIQFAETVTKGQFSPISDVLSVSLSNVKAKP